MCGCRVASESLITMPLAARLECHCAMTEWNKRDSDAFDRKICALISPCVNWLGFRDRLRLTRIPLPRVSLEQIARRGRPSMNAADRYWSPADGNAHWMRLTIRRTAASARLLKPECWRLFSRCPCGSCCCNGVGQGSSAAPLSDSKAECRWATQGIAVELVLLPRDHLGITITYRLYIILTSSLFYFQ